MALTDKVLVADCYHCPKDSPDHKFLKKANEQLFAYIKQSRLFPKTGRMLDLDAGYEGSDFIAQYQSICPGMQTVYSDNFPDFVKELRKPTKLCSDARQLPLKENTFSLTYAGYLTNAGIVKNHWHTKDASYRIAQESFRVLEKNGLFVFTQQMDTPTDILSEIGFHSVKHVQRINWLHERAEDLYVARK